jgi:hypothetical protein
MTIPEHFYRFLSGITDYQENIDFDSNGNELYHGIAPNTAVTSDPFWVIAKGIYTPITVNGVNVTVMTHVSFLRGQIWDNRASISFP